MKRLLIAVFVLLAVVASFAHGQTLSAAPSSLYTSQSVTGTWGGISTPTAQDWVGLYVTGSADTAFLTWSYTGGGASGSLSLVVPANAAAGTYELRLFANNGYTLLATSNSVTVQVPPPATLSASPASVYASQSVTATWGSIFAPTALDWVGLYPVGAADTAFVAWVYTNGAASGNGPLTVPATAAAGSYELRLFSNNGYSKLATSGAFSVQTPPPATLSASPASVFTTQQVSAAWGSIFAPTALDWVGLYPVGAADTAFVAWVYTDGNTSGSGSITVPANAAAGTYELRLFSNNGYTRLASSNTFAVQTPPAATLSVSPSSVAPGGSVTAAWTNIFAPTGTDWIGLYAPSAADTAFISWRYTTGTAAGNVPFSIGATVAPGTYQLRLFSANGYTRLATSANFSVGQMSLFYIHPDHLNTPRLVADASQNAVWKWDNQEPFGNDSPNKDPGNTGAPFEFNVRFPGQYADLESGRFNNYLRDCYDSAIGRYCESDPIGLLGGTNTYSYVQADPIRVADPSGANPFVIQVLLGAASGVVLADAGLAYYIHTRDLQIQANFKLTLITTRNLCAQGRDEFCAVAKQAERDVYKCAAESVRSGAQLVDEIGSGGRYPDNAEIINGILRNQRR